MQESFKTDIIKLFKSTFAEEIESFEPLPLSGSSRLYFRVRNKFRSVVAAYNPDRKENSAFIHISKVFKQFNLPVPEIYADDLEKHIYLQQDLGNETLFDRIESLRQKNDFPDELIELYKKISEQLIELQMNAGKRIDYSLCYPRAAFDKQSMMWDLNYFKYQFLKYTDVSFDEQLLENDFHYLSDFLLNAKSDFFLFRDFQSRNIMLSGNQVYFIDYQGGRKGALQYDLASLLFDSKAQIPFEIRNIILEHYVNKARNYPEFNEAEFRMQYPGFVLIRLLQAFGAYGYRGLYEKKQLFIDSIRIGLNSLNELLANTDLFEEMQELKRVLSLLPQSKKLLSTTQAHKLNVTIKSFAYKRGIPYDETGNGGGHVFDCRFINNPGKLDAFKDLTGKHQEIIDFLEKQNETKEFWEAVKTIVFATILNYRSRGFKNLSINFGCTGGRHRSVFFAQKIYELILKEFDVNLNIIHTEL
jgi:aminoglycoside/choline kinase family phosphotransferase